ncbi:MAG TPA: TolC family protein [Polyangiaceae bacterium]|nr:TolC family protein [Polyangiaceae bacterium]
MTFKTTLLSSLLTLIALPALSTPAFAETPSDASFESRLARELGVAGGLTADDLAARAVATSYTIEARRSDVSAADATVSRASAGYIPKLTLSARYSRLSKTKGDSAGSLVVAPLNPNGVLPANATLVKVPLEFDTLPDNYSIGASLQVPVSDYFLRVSKSESQAEFAKSAAEQNLISAERAAATDARGLYYSWVGARLSVVVAEVALEQARAHGEDVRHAVDAGTASKADALRVESRIAESERVLDAARHSAADLEEQIRIARHDAPEQSYAIGEDVRGELPQSELPERLPDLSQYAFSHRPELAAAKARIAATAKSAEIERAAMFPRLDLVANAQYANPNSRVFPQEEKFRGSWDAGAQLTWVISDIPGANSAARAASASSAAAQAEARALEDQVRRQVSAALQSLLDARAAIRTSEHGLAASEESYRVRRALFQNGRATSTELLDAELDLTQARRSALNARLELRMARARLDFAVGRGTNRASQGG